MQKFSVLPKMVRSTADSWKFTYLAFQCFLCLVQIFGIIIFFYILSFFFSESRWTVSSYIVFPVTGLVVTSLLVVVLIEKFTCVPKRLSRLILHLTGNKMLHQLMAITNTLTLLSCVLLPMVRLLHFHWICPQWGQILWKNAAALVH